MTTVLPRAPVLVHHQVHDAGFGSLVIFAVSGQRQARLPPRQDFPKEGRAPGPLAGARSASCGRTASATSQERRSGGSGSGGRPAAGGGAARTCCHRRRPPPGRRSVPAELRCVAARAALAGVGGHSACMPQALQGAATPASAPPTTPCCPFAAACHAGGSTTAPDGSPLPGAGTLRRADLERSLQPFSAEAIADRVSWPGVRPGAGRSQECSAKAWRCVPVNTRPARGLVTAGAARHAARAGAGRSRVAARQGRGADRGQDSGARRVCVRPGQQRALVMSPGAPRTGSGRRRGDAGPLAGWERASTCPGGRGFSKGRGRLGVAASQQAAPPPNRPPTWCNSNQRWGRACRRKLHFTLPLHACAPCLPSPAAPGCTCYPDREGIAQPPPPPCRLQPF